MNLPLHVGSRCSVALMAGFLVSSEAHAVIIDDFSTGYQLLTVSVPTPSATDTVVASGAIGGERRIEAKLTSPGGSANCMVIPNGIALGGASSSASQSYSMVWDGGGLGLGDLTDGGNASAFFLDFIQVDPGHKADFISFSFEAISTDLGTATITKSIDRTFDPLNPLVFPFADASYSPGGNSSIFESVDELRLTAHLDCAADFAIRSARTDRVPDGGSSLVLLGLSTCLVGAAKRFAPRRKSQGSQSGSR